MPRSETGSPPETSRPVWRKTRAPSAQRPAEQDDVPFGRTPRVNRTADRDHWAPLSSLALAG